eukprot:COSAG05_NODE_2246_length_3345_cov_5.452671_3_plen_51_part_00
MHATRVEKGTGNCTADDYISAGVPRYSVYYLFSEGFASTLRWLGSFPAFW